ncbi:hypothetical protein [Pedobacter sp. SYP-B3415]|uniref:GldL-related protein n=1 Tax=Pedobacter sp. SYP-B3415 TaxID=2496641 RepID=UPI00101DADDC|nr:hypothetical protein [Pedobacter sp. SYP-B3415]
MKQKRKFRVTINSVTSWGASVVIIGVMAKLLRWQAADSLIIAGMLTEAVLFFILGFQREDDDDTAVAAQPVAIPASAGHPATGAAVNNSVQPAATGISGGTYGGNKGTAVTTGFSAETTVAYDAQVEELVRKLTFMNRSFEKMAADFQALENQAETAQRVQHEMEKMAKNLTAINSVYRNMLSAMNMPGA